MRTLSKSFTKVILQLYSYIFFGGGILLLFFTKQISLITFVGVPAKITIVIHQFLGSAYILLGVMMYIAKNLKGKPLLITIAALNVMGFVNLYLAFVFNQLIILSIVYFIFSVLMQLVLLFALIEQIKNKK